MPALCDEYFGSLHGHRLNLADHWVSWISKIVHLKVVPELIESDNTAIIMLCTDAASSCDYFFSLKFWFAVIFPHIYDIWRQLVGNMPLLTIQRREMT